MPAKSKQQAKLMGAVISGKAKVPGLSKAEAREFLRGTDVKSLPTRASKFPKLDRLLNKKKKKD